MNSTDTKQNGSNTLCEDIKVSCFKNAKSSKKTQDISISEYLALVSDQTKKAEAERLRALPADEYKKAKLLKPCITGSCVMDADGRSLKNILFLNGLAVIDFDVLPNGYNDWQEFKGHLENDPYTSIVHFSLSGRGLCVFVKIPKENNFKEIYLSFVDYYDLMFGAKIDFLADESRLRIIAFDSNPFYNPGSEIYTDILQQQDQTAEPIQQDNDNVLDSFSNNPSTAFNNSGLAGLEIINGIFENLGYTITTGKKPTIFEYQRAGGSLKSIVAFYNSDVVKFKRFSTNTGLKKEHYNLYELYTELKNLEDYAAQKELAGLDFGVFEEPTKLLKSSGKETYSLNMDFLEAKGIALNLLTGVIEINGAPLTDVHLSMFIAELSLLSGKNQSKDILNSCIDVLANSNQSHPLLNYLEKLENLPKTDFTKSTAIDRFINCFESSTPKPLFRIYLVRWLLGLFDLHVHNRMTKNVLLLSGLQNSGKTSFAKNLLPEELKTYGKVVQYDPFKAVDNKVSLCSTLIAVFDEAEDILSKSKTLSDFKALTSTYDILERRAYRRNPELMFRSSIIMMTSNEKSVLNDSSGNTRFLTIDIQSFDLKEYLKIDIDLIWKEIHDLHLLGQTSILNEAERALQERENVNFESEDFVCGLIQNIFNGSKDGFLTATELLLEMEKHTKQPINLTKIGKALRKLNIERVAKKIKGKVLRGYNLKHRFEE